MWGSHDNSTRAGEGIVRGTHGHVPAPRPYGANLHPRREATGRANAGPAFTPGKSVADHLMFVRIDFGAGTAAVLYNGPEAPVRELLPPVWSGTKVLPLSDVLAKDAMVHDNQRLFPLG
jgi:hypothetical protein